MKHHNAQKPIYFQVNSSRIGTYNTSLLDGETIDGMPELRNLQNIENIYMPNFRVSDCVSQSRRITTITQ